MPPAPIKVLIVEDCAITRDLLTRILSSIPEIRVVHCAKNGSEALAWLAEGQPDVVTMDIHMPGLDGYEVTRQIMETRPVPIIIVSSAYDAEDVTQTFRAMEAGAVAAVEKPPGPGAADYERMARKLTDMVRAMAAVRVVKRWPHARARVRAQGPAAPHVESTGSPVDVQIVVIGASTGGPPVLEVILSALPKPFPVPLLIVQHISSGFVHGLADWLTQRSGIPVRVAADGDRAAPGQAYLAPDASHLTVGPGGRITCRTGEPESGLQPAVSCLFRSALAAYGKNAVGVLLSGMGRDGADELKRLRDAGAVTIVQDKESSIVHGMPGAAVELGAALHVLPPGRIAEVLGGLVAHRIPAMPSTR